MYHILLVAFGNELEKAWNIINRNESVIKHVITLPTNNLSGIIENNHIKVKISFFESLPEVLSENYFDFILVSDILKVSGKKGRLVEELERLGCSSNCIIDLSDIYTHEIMSMYSLLKHQRENFDAYSFFITGVSHAYAGTDIREYSSLGMNLANTSQDLFLDYQMAKLVVQSMQGKKAIIGVAPFSLHYDLSLSVNRNRMLMYYPLIKELHNYHISDEKLEKILNNSYINSYELIDNSLSLSNRLGCNSLDKNLTIDDFLNMRRELSFWDYKSYPETVKENVSILHNYIDMCLSYAIKPTLVIFPVSEWYNKYFSHVKFDELRTILHDIADVYNISFYDFSNDSRFTAIDFFDAEHLNVHGAKKISSILNNIIISE